MEINIKCTQSIYLKMYANILSFWHFEELKYRVSCLTNPWNWLYFYFILECSHMESHEKGCWHWNCSPNPISKSAFSAFLTLSFASHEALIINPALDNSVHCIVMTKIRPKWIMGYIIKPYTWPNILHINCSEFIYNFLSTTLFKFIR